MILQTMFILFLLTMIFIFISFWLWIGPIYTQLDEIKKQLSHQKKGEE